VKVNRCAYTMLIDNFILLRISSLRTKVILKLVNTSMIGGWGLDTLG
jgi:hypothetical protein